MLCEFTSEEVQRSFRERPGQGVCIDTRALLKAKTTAERIDTLTKVVSKLHECYVTARDKEYAGYLQHFCHDPACSTYGVDSKPHLCHDVKYTHKEVSVLGATQNAIDGGKIRTFVFP